MDPEGLNETKQPNVRKKRVLPKRPTSSRTLGVRTIGKASQRLKELWADPEWRAALLVKRQVTINARPTFEGRYGVPDGMRKRTAVKLWDEAKESAERTMAELKEAGVMPEADGGDPQRAEEALKEALTIMRFPGDKKLKLSAAALVLKYTKSPPVTKSELTVNKAEEWLKAVAEDNDANETTGDAEASAD